MARSKQAAMMAALIGIAVNVALKFALVGTFAAGDSVSVLDPEGREIARGLTRFSAVDAARIAGRKPEGGPSAEVIHKDDLVVLPEE